jgi:hypothetical protein
LNQAPGKSRRQTTSISRVNPVLSLRETARSGRDSGDEIITTITDSASRPMSQCWSVPAGDSSFWPELNLPVMNSLPARRNRPRVRHVMTDASPRNGHSSNQASVINCGSIVSRLEADDWITVLFWTGLDLVSSFPAPTRSRR